MKIYQISFQTVLSMVRSSKEVEIISTLHEVVEKGKLRKVRRLLDEGADVNDRGEYGFTPLHKAAVEGHIKMAEFLLDRDADVKAKDDDGGAPLGGKNREDV